MGARAEIRVVYMGDSITYGQYVDHVYRWTDLVDGRLRERFPDLHLETFNRGISGETTLMGLARFSHDVQEVEPDLMTLHFGLNDCNCWETDRGLPRVSERAYAANLVEMIARARHFGARRVIVMTNHRTLRRAALPSGEVYEEASERYSQLMREVAAETGATLCDIRAAFDEYLLPPPDVLHLSIAGNAAYAELIWPTIERTIDELIKESGT